MTFMIIIKNLLVIGKMNMWKNVQDALERMNVAVSFHLQKNINIVITLNH